MPSPPHRPIRVLVVDDSAVVRQMITSALQTDPDIEVVGTAVDPYVAKDRIAKLQPDVITLDLEMPRMDGLTFLRLLMEHRPLPVIILSSLTQSGSQKALEALRLGAVEVLGKPGSAYTIGQLGPQLVQRVKAAAMARPRCSAAPVPLAAPASRTPPAPASGSTRLLLLGASTGGTEALREVMVRWPADVPPVAVVQHIPAQFSRAFAERLNQLCPFAVKEAEDGDRLQPGLALIAPGDRHLLLVRDGTGFRARVTGGPMVWHQRPAVDVLFRSAAEIAGPRCVAAVLTGMGRDGAEGLLALRRKGARTFAQDEATSVVYGMPRVAAEIGGAERILPLDQIAQAMLAAASAPQAQSVTS